jgi:diguanylate cyclase (GGDEF)-like protein
MPVRSGRWARISGLPDNPDETCESGRHAEAIVSDTRDAGGGALPVLSAGAAALARAADLDTGLAGLLDAACRAVGADVAAVFAQDPDRAGLELLAAHGMSAEAAAAFESDVAGDPEHPIHRAAVEREGVLGRPGTAPHGTATVGADLPLTITRSGIDTPIGVLSFGWTGAHEIGPDEADLLRAVADLTAVAIDHSRVASLAAERAEWFERMAHSDPLTGLTNARTLQRVLELEVIRASRQDGEVSVAVVDIDRFAAATASGGRTGDRILREVAAVLAECVRVVDTVARTGGDEFVLVAPGSAGMTVAQRVVERVAALPEVEGHQVSVSVGVARFPIDGTDGDSLLEAARGALTRARAAGTAVVEAPGLAGAPATE